MGSDITAVLQSKMLGVGSAVLLVATGAMISNTTITAPLGHPKPTPSITDPSKVTVSTEAQGTSDGSGISMSNPGKTQVDFRTVKLDPGGSTGWHYHPGPLLAVVKSGTLTEYFYDAKTDRCVRKVRKVGDAFVEEIGRNHTHIGLNLGDTPVILATSYVVPKGAQLATPVAAPPVGATGCWPK
ncbi:cupin domain-containing protein [Streptomyces vinaceus]